MGRKHKRRRQGAGKGQVQASPPAQAAPRRRPAADPELAGSLLGSGRPEPWTLACLALGAGVFAGWVFLLMRPGGAAPVWFYSHGRFLAVLVALGLLAVGVVLGLRRRPFLGRRRLLGFLVLVLVIGAAPFPVPYPSSREGRPSSVVFRLPAEGSWRVVFGGDQDSSPLAFLPERRWGLCLVREGPEGGRLRPEAGPEPQAADFLAFGEPVLAPAAGTVVAAVDGFPDRERGAPTAVQVPPAGNHVVLEVAEGEFLVLPFLRSGSVRVSPGQGVQAGQELGQVGASGSGALFAEPHLAVHLQTLPEPFRGEGIPWRLSGTTVGGVPVRPSLPRGGVAWDGSLTGQEVAPAGGSGPAGGAD